MYVINNMRKYVIIILNLYNKLNIKVIILN